MVGITAGTFRVSNGFEVIRHRNPHQLHPSDKMDMQTLHTEGIAEAASRYRSFLDELHSLLKGSGIAPFRLPVTAEAGREENRSGKGREIQTVTGRIVLYMEEHLAEPFTLEDLARRAGLSKYQLIRRFREEQGITPWQLLIEKRIEKAGELLEEGIAPGQAALETGFYDQSHFHHRFREATGLTPKEYQEQNFKNRN